MKKKLNEPLLNICNILTKDINRFYSPMKREEEIECVIKAKAGDINAQSKLVCSQLKSILGIALKFRSYTNKLEDLVNEGAIGLIHSISKYDLGKHSKIRFGTYAMWWVMASINEFVYDNTLIRYPRNYKRLKKDVVQPVSLQSPISEYVDNTITFEDVIQDESCEPIELMIEHDLVMNKLNITLTARELGMVMGRCVDDMTLENLCSEFNFNNKECARQNFNRALAKAQAIFQD